MKQRISLTVTNRRPAEAFFRRNHEIFERKFDGIPAQFTESPLATVDPEGLFDDIDIDKIIDTITGGFQDEVVISCNEPLVALSKVEDAYVTPTEARFIIDVYFDGIPAVRGSDYDLCGDTGVDVCPTSLLSESIIVSARYVEL